VGGLGSLCATGLVAESDRFMSMEATGALCYWSLSETRRCQRPLLRATAHRLDRMHHVAIQATQSALDGGCGPAVVSACIDRMTVARCKPHRSLK